MADNDEQRKDSNEPDDGSVPTSPSEDGFAEASSPDAPAPQPGEVPAADEVGAGAEELSDEQLDAEEAFAEGFSAEELSARAAQAEDEDTPDDADEQPPEPEELEPVTLDDLFPPEPVEEDVQEEEQQPQPTPEEVAAPQAAAEQGSEQPAAEGSEQSPEGQAEAEGDAPPEEAQTDEAQESSALAEALATNRRPAGHASVGGAKVVYLLASMNVLLVVLVAGVLAGVYLWMGGRPPRPAEGTLARQAAPVEPEYPDITDANPSSWRLAEKAYVDGKSAEAGARYEHLLRLCRSQSDADLAADFCRFRVARCLIRLGRQAEAAKQLESICTSRSPIIRAAAGLALAELDCSGHSFLRARMKAYQALAAVAAVDGQETLESDAEFLIARCLTEKALSFTPADGSVPWKRPPRPADPFVNVEAAALHDLLAEGVGAGDALLGPRIEQAPSRPIASRWAVRCCRTGLEELLQQFAARTATEVQWVDVSADVRQRAVTMGFRSGSSERVFEVACGAAGLIGRFTGEKVLIHNPHTMASMAEQRSLIKAEAVSAWRRFYLRFPSDPRSGQGHFALALLSERSGEVLAALREYRLIARRYPRDEVAPWALLRGAGLRIGLADHRGARADLSDLLNLYPDFAAIDQAHLDLGRAALQAGRPVEALDIFRKLYYLDLSTRSQALACLNAGRCLFSVGEHAEACKWLGRYANLSPDKAGPEMAEAYLLTGRCLAKLGNAPEASSAFRHALHLKPTDTQRVEALLALADAEMQRRRFGQALAALDEADKEKLTADQYARAALARTRAFRAMGLPDRGLSVLRRAAPNVRDRAVQAEMSVEAARCHADAGERDAARKILADLLPTLGAGETAREASIELAKLCLADGKAAQTVAICRNLLSAPLPEPRRKAVLDLLAKAYRQQQDPEHVALALSGLAGGNKTPEKP